MPDKPLVRLCATCEKPISQARLAALPHTEWCVKCSQEQQRSEDPLPEFNLETDDD